MNAANRIVINAELPPARCCFKCPHGVEGCHQRSGCVDYAVETLTRELERKKLYSIKKAQQEVYTLKAKAARVKISER